MRHCFIWAGIYAAISAVLSIFSFMLIETGGAVVGSLVVIFLTPSLLVGSLLGLEGSMSFRIVLFVFVVHFVFAFVILNILRKLLKYIRDACAIKN